MRLAVAAIAALLLAPAGALACTAGTDPSIPTWQSVNGFELGARKATVAEMYAFVDAVDAASDEVQGGTLAESWNGRPLRYLVVSERGNLDRLDEIAATMRSLRDGAVPENEIAAVAASEPAIVWSSSNVHGNEPSGADASMRLLYELAARTDCENEARKRDLVTVILPTQNPDGREANTRQNAYGFDMNRDWFARTQPETDGKLDLISQYPPILYIDAHEQGGLAGFFPPNADPIHHEISDTALGHINDVYGPAMRERADAAGFDYTNYTTYDLFFMGFGDTVPATAFGSAGMTFEKGGSSPYTEKTFEQWTTQDASVNAAAAGKDRLLEEWARQFVEARAQGARGELEPNLVVQPTNEVRFTVPEQRVHGYVLRTDRHAGDALKLAERLRSFGVEVFELTGPASLDGFRGFGETAARTETLPAGTLFVPSAQAQKHWVQAILGEDAYVPFPYFYDVSGWSNPLLMGVEGGIATTVADGLPLERWAPRPAPSAAVHSFAGDSSVALGAVHRLLKAGAEVRRSGERYYVAGASADTLAGVDARPESAVAGTPVRAPKIALLQPATGGQSYGFARYALQQQLDTDVTVVSPTTLESGALLDGRFTHVVAPDGTATGGITPLGLAQLQFWVRGGGTFVGYRSLGLTLARAAGLTTALPKQAGAGFTVPGASFATTVDAGDPVTAGEDGTGWVFNTGDPIIEPGTSGGRVLASYTPGGFRSGYAEGTDVLAGTTAALHERVGSGHAVLFTFDPNFRAYVEGGLRMFARALLLEPAPVVAGADVLPVQPKLLRSATLSEGRDTVVRVGDGDAGVLRDLLGSLPAGSTVTGSTLRIPNPTARDPHERTEIPRLMRALRDVAVELLVI